ncbi:MAG: hypothetical protein LBM96_11815 [Methanobrevibacter sp.]|jgi:hypothetical protein|nr:hypothetical protein [Candidatus Methanoflexus mossambicus]
MFEEIKTTTNNIRYYGSKKNQEKYLNDIKNFKIDTSLYKTNQMRITKRLSKVKL